MAKRVPSRGLKQAMEGRGVLKPTQSGGSKEKAFNVQHEYRGQDIIEYLNKFSK